MYFIKSITYTLLLGFSIHYHARIARNRDGRQEWIGPGGTVRFVYRILRHHVCHDDGSYGAHAPRVPLFQSLDDDCVCSGGGSARVPPPP